MNRWQLGMLACVIPTVHELLADEGWLKLPE